MIKEEDLLQELNGFAEESFVPFQARLLRTNKKILGVRTPALRSLAKKYRGRYLEFKPFTSDIYEVSFLKLALAEKLPYEELLKELPYLLSEMDTWALTDSCKPKAILTRKEDYKEEISSQLNSGKEFFERFALVTLLWAYRQKEDLPFVFSCMERADNEKYYISMASAWLLSEILTRHYEEGLAFLKENTLPAATHNKAIQKARESFRIPLEEKGELLSLKR